jgi:hypothetical protein
VNPRQTSSQSTLTRQRSCTAAKPPALYASDSPGASQAPEATKHASCPGTRCRSTCRASENSENSERSDFFARGEVRSGQRGDRCMGSNVLPRRAGFFTAGYGQIAIGGRGEAVVHVRNLNDAGVANQLTTPSASAIAWAGARAGYARSTAHDEIHDARNDGLMATHANLPSGHVSLPSGHAPAHQARRSPPRRSSRSPGSPTAEPA